MARREAGVSVMLNHIELTMLDNGLSRLGFTVNSDLRKRITSAMRRWEKRYANGRVLVDHIDYFTPTRKRQR